MIPGSTTACDMNPKSSRSTKRYITDHPSTVSTVNRGLMCSQQSILSAMERFVQSINNMDDTVLVPSKLRDMDIIGLNKSPTRHVPATMTNAELHNFYLMLNDVKKELLWGTSSASSSCSIMTPTSHHHEFLFTSNSNPIVPFNRSNSVASSSSTSQIVKNSSANSTAQSDDCLGSLGSSISSNVSDSESDAGDSMMTDRDSIEDPTSHLFVAFRHHLQGLNSILHQLADSADYLSLRYQEEIEDS